MLNIENGYTLYNEDLTLRTGKDVKPMCNINNVKKNEENNVKKNEEKNEENEKNEEENEEKNEEKNEDNISSYIHYRPTTGVIFYNASINFNLEQFVLNIVEIIKHYEFHLLIPKITNISSSVQIKHEKFIAGTYCGKYQYFKQTLSGKLPARLLNYAENNNNELPPYYSVRSAFTWFFIPITSVIKLTNFINLNQVNIMLASIFYDTSNLCKFKDNDEVFKISINDFNIKHIENPFSEKNALLISSIEEIDKIDENNKKIKFIDNYKLLIYSHLNLVDSLPNVNWENIESNTFKKTECFNCACKNINDCIAVDVKSILLFDLVNSMQYILLCLECWIIYLSKNFKGFKINNFQSGELNFYQKKFDKKQVFQIIQGVYKIIYNDEVILLIAENLGLYPNLTIPEIANMNLPIMCNVQIII